MKNLEEWIRSRRRTTLPTVLTFDPDDVLDHETAVGAGGGETHAGLDFGYRADGSLRFFSSTT